MSYPLSHPISSHKPWVNDLAVLAYIDLLFFPYFQAFIIPFSLPLIVVGMLAMGKVTLPSHTITSFFAIAFLMLVSMGIGFFLPQSAPYSIENIKRVAQFTTSFFYLAFFFSVARHYHIEKPLRIISLAFVAYFSVWLVWFIFEPLSANATINHFYGRLVTAKDVVLIHFRFAYLFTDPNTAGYFLLIATLPWLMLYKNMAVKIAIVALCFVIAILVQSRGVLLSLILAVLLEIFPRRWWMFRFRVRKLRSLLKNTLIMAVVGGIVTVAVVKYFAYNPAFDMGLKRISDEESYRQGDSRYKIWKKYATTLTPFPIGRGYQFDTETDIVRGQFFPHSDLMRLIYSYGFIAAGLFVWWLLRKGWNYPLVLMPAFMAFGINSLIDEQKLFGLFLATLGVLLGMHQRKRTS